MYNYSYVHVYIRVLHNYYICVDINVDSILLISAAFEHCVLRELAWKVLRRFHNYSTHVRFMKRNWHTHFARGCGTAAIVSVNIQCSNATETRALSCSNALHCSAIVDIFHINCWFQEWRGFAHKTKTQ